MDKSLLRAGGLASLLLVAGCGGSTSDAPAPAAPTATAAADAKGGAVTVVSSEYAFAPKAITAKAGEVRFTLDNKGSIPHELVVLKTSEAPDALKVGTDQRVNEDTSVGEVAEIPGGAKKSTTLDLKPGTYVYVCNIPTHYGDGMRGVLTVK